MVEQNGAIMTLGTDVGDFCWRTRFTYTLLCNHFLVCIAIILCVFCAEVIIKQLQHHNITCEQLTHKELTDLES